ncbi:LOW QUALITY PROTEIN: hypothetical protein CFOL_v3_16119, partial [Cephalotus follicularis]
MDAKDIVGLSKTPLPITQEKKPQPKKDSQRKPNGISHGATVYALTGGLAPLMPSLDFSQLKKRPPAVEKISWEWFSFTSSARKDNLQLYHWVRVVNGVPPTGDYSFASLFHVTQFVNVVKYTHEEYDKYLIDPMWSKEETDQLFNLCERFDLRSIVIANKFPLSWAVEELKDRYYSVFQTILIARVPSYADVLGHPLVKDAYNISQEKERKRALCMVLSQTKQQREKRCWRSVFYCDPYQYHNKFGEESAEMANVPGDVSPTSNVQFPSVEVAPSTLASLRMVSLKTFRLHLYLRTYALDQMVQVARSSAGLRTIKRMEQTLLDLGVNLKPRVPMKVVCVEHLELRKEILTLLNLQKQV